MIKFILKLVFFLSFICSLYANNDTLKLNNYITDQANILSFEEITKLEDKLKTIYKQTTNQIVVVILDEIKDNTIESYAIDLATYNKIGTKGKDNGVLILFDMKNRSVRIEVGYGLEPIITDYKASKVIKDIIVPNFQNQKYYTGIDNSINRIVSLIKTGETNEAEYNINEPRASSSIFLIMILVSIVLTSYVINKKKKFQVLSKKDIVILCFISFILVVGSEYLQNNVNNNIVGFIFLSLILTVFSVKVFPKIIIKFLSKEIASRIMLIDSLDNRDEKIKKVFKLYNKSNQDFSKYRHSVELEKYKDKFEVFKDLREKEIYKNIFKKYDDNKLFFINLDKKDECIYELVHIIYEKNKLKQINLLAMSEDKIIGSKENISLKELSTYLNNKDKYWGIIKNLSFAQINSKSSSNGSSRSSGSSFSGGGGSFGGGGSSGRW